MSRFSEQELEEIMRSGLQARADRLEAGVPDVGRLRRRPRRAVWLASAAAAAVVAVGVPVVVGALNDGAPDRGPQVADVPAIPDSWRFESFAGLQVRVPPGWGWGGAPFESSWGDGVLDCGADAFTLPGSDAYEDVPDGTPYVGRPKMMTDVCQGGVGADWQPHGVMAPFVWLDAEVPTGTRQLGDGYVMVTQAFGEHRVTVASPDAHFRAQVLATAEVVEVDANGCRTRLDAAPAATKSDEAGTEVDHTVVCAYEKDGDHVSLLYSRVLPGPVPEPTNQPVIGCSSDAREEGQWIALTQVGSGVLSTWVVHPDGCGVDVGRPGQEALDVAFVRSWADARTRAYVWGGDVPDDVRGFFRGILG